MKREARQHGMIRTRLLPPPWNPRIKNKVIHECNSPAADLYAKVLSKPTNLSKFTCKCGKPRCMSCHLHPACKSRGKGKGTQKLRSYDVAVNFRLFSWRVVDKGVGLNYTGVSASDMLSHLYGKYPHEIEDEEGDIGEEVMFEGHLPFVDRSVKDGGNLAQDFGASRVKIQEDDEGIGASGADIEEDDYEIGASGVDIEEDDDEIGANGADDEDDEEIGASGADIEEDHEIGASGVDIEEDDDDIGASGADDEDDEEIGASGVDVEEEDDMGFYCVGIVWDCMDDDGDWCVVGEM